MASLFSNIMFFIFAFILSYITSWKLSGTMTLVVPIIIGVTAVAMNYIGKSEERKRKNFEKAGGVAEEVLYNYKTTASFANFDYEKNRFNSLTEECCAEGLKMSLTMGVSTAFIMSSIFASYSIAFMMGCYLLSIEDTTSTGEPFTPGSIVQVIFQIVFATVTLGTASTFLTKIKMCVDASEDFFWLSERKSKMDLSASKDSSSEIKGQFEFKNVCFSYENNNLTLDSINIALEEGKKTALVGPSGSGKSTMANTLLRLYDPTSGTILLDGKDLKEYCVKHLRRNIGYVPQEPVLFDQSIAENIRFGREASEEEVREACKRAYCDEFISELKGGLNYQVGVKGSKLSGGQKQRIAIARAVLKDPKVLILDEATSALDNKSEKIIQKALDAVSEGRTTIIVAHRLSTIINSDKILVLDAGKVIEEGKHAELLENKGRYADLIKNQIDSLVKEEDSGVEEQESVGSFDSRDDSVRGEEEKDKEDKEFVSKNKGKIWDYLKDMKLEAALALFGSAISGLIWPVYGFLIADIMADVFKAGLAPNPAEEYIHTGIIIAIKFLVVAIVAFFGTMLQNYMFSRIGEKLANRVRKDVFSKYLQLSMDFYDKDDNSPGSLITRLASDSTTINGVTMQILGTIIQSIMSLGIGVLMAFLFCWQMATLMVCCSPVQAVGMTLQSRYLKKIREGRSENDQAAGSTLSQVVTNTKTVFAYNFEEEAYKMYSKISFRNEEGLFWSSFLNGLLFGVSSFTRFAIYGVYYYAGALMIREEYIDADQMFKAILLIMLSMFGIFNASIYLPDQSKVDAAFKSIFQTLQYPVDINTDDPAKKTVEGISGEIEFKNVEFAYPSNKNKQILKKINFKVESGSSVAFVGPSGCGKSTIVNLIDRFYDVTEGQILIDGVDIREYNLVSLRKQIGVVLQEPVLFKTSVKENIRYGDLGATDDKVLEAAKKAFIDHKLDLSAKEAKSNVSGGEKQRIAIARAIIKQCGLVVLDEATSALDKSSEEIVQQALDNLTEGTTTLTIAHRLSTIINSDKIFYMEKGEILEEGTHSELLNKDGKYASLYRASQS